MTSQVERTQAITLVELLMTLIIVSIIMVSIYNVLQHSLQAHSHVEAQAEVTQNARMAMERLSKEVRQAGEFLLNCNVGLITFAVDFNGNGVLTDDGERIRYRISGGNLERQYRLSGQPWSATEWEVIANYVTNFTLTYRDENNNVMLVPPALSPSERNAVRLISADISLEKGREWGEDSYTVELRTSAHPRNR